MVVAHQKLITPCTADFSSRDVVGFIAVLVNAVVVGTTPEDVFLVASIVGVCRLLWPTEMPKNLQCAIGAQIRGFIRPDYSSNTRDVPGSKIPRT